MALNWFTGVDGITISVQAGFGYAPSTALSSVVWTDISTYVRRLAFDRGRSDELDTYQAGRLSMTLDNRDRRFDPLHAAGPYFANLKPMVPVRVRLKIGASVTSTIWTGYVSGFPQTYDPPRDATVTVTATDGFSILQRTKMPSFYEYEVRRDLPVLWWRLGEQAGTTAVDSSTALADGVYSGGATFNTRAGLVVGTDNAIEFDGTQDAQKSGFQWPVFPFTFELWFKTQGDLVTPTNNVYPFLVNADNSRLVAFALNNTTAAVAYATPTVTLQTTVTASYINNAVHHVIASFPDATTAPSMYIDGVAVGTPSASGTAVEVGPSKVTVANISNLVPAFSGAFAGTIDEVAVYPTALDASRAAAHYSAGHAPFEGLTTGSAIDYALTIVGWPSSDKLLDTGRSTVTTFDSSGRTALDVIKLFEATESGRFFFSGIGQAAFYDRYHTLLSSRSTTSTATFGDLPATELPYHDVELDFGEDKIRNSVTTSRTGGGSYTVSDPTSRAAYGEREFSITGLLNTSDGEMRDLAYWQLTHYKDPITRVRTLEIKPRRSPAAIADLIRTWSLAERVTVNRRPQGVGSVISFDALIEGMSNEITVNPLDWTVKLFLSPAETQAYWVMDDTVLSVLGTSTRLAF